MRTKTPNHKRALAEKDDKALRSRSSHMPRGKNYIGRKQETKLRLSCCLIAGALLLFSEDYAGRWPRKLTQPQLDAPEPEVNFRTFGDLAKNILSYGSVSVTFVPSKELQRRKCRKSGRKACKQDGQRPCIKECHKRSWGKFTAPFLIILVASFEAFDRFVTQTNLIST